MFELEHQSDARQFACQFPRQFYKLASQADPRQFEMLASQLDARCGSHDLLAKDTKTKVKKTGKP